MTETSMASIDTAPLEAPLRMDLAWLLSPFNDEVFVNRYWTKEPLRISRDDNTYYSRLLPEGEMELALYAASQARGPVELLSEGDIPENCRSHEHALEGFRQGKSLRIDAVHRYSHAIMMLARNLEEIVHCPVNVNMYLTPGAGKKALKRHYDTHDVFVLQVHGNKTWRLFDPPFPCPLEFLPLQRYESMRAMKRFRLDHDLSVRDSCILTDEFTLSAGDCLYLPRGFWHEAESKPGEVSCHLTVGIQPTTYLDVLSVALSQAALSELRLREQLPFGFAADPAAGRTVAARVAEIVEELPLKLDVEAALGKVAAHSLRSHRTGFQNNLLRRFDNNALDCLDVESRVRVREGMSCTFEGNTLPARMTINSQIFEISPTYEEACRFIANARGFSVSELPGNMELPEKLALVQQLITEGLLTLSPGGVAAVGLSCESVRWLPIDLDRRADTIQWLDFGTQSLTRPFFQQSVRQLKKENPNAKMRSTSVRALEELGEEISPSGFIFHVSRCGSTLLSNGLRAISGALVVAEAQPIGQAVAFLSESSPHVAGNGSRQIESQGHLLRGIVRAYGQHRTNGDKALIIKFSSWNILHIAAIRRLWPKVPCVIVVRDPIEVAVSCLKDPPGWMRWRSQPSIAQSMLGWDSEILASMSLANFCARVIGEFLKSASSAVYASCQVIDYRDLNGAMILDVARLFGMEIRDADFKNIEKSLLVYSKDFSGKRVFIGDIEFKQAKATIELRKEIQIWAQQAYDNISRESCYQ
jgi:ribosomal protein L16 Arg81 hydroxylase